MSRFVLHTLFIASLLTAALLSTAACGSSNDLFPTAPTAPPTPPTITETFSGSINRNSAITHPFLAQASGSVTLTLTTLAPDTVSAIGMSLGTWNGQSCQIVIANTNAVQGNSIVGVASSAGNLCVFVQDVGKITNVASYEVSVVHP